MNEQLSLFGPPEPPASQYKYVFLGIFPDLYTAQYIANRTNTLCQKHGLLGRVRPASHLHVSVPFLSGSIGVSEKVIDHVCKAVASVTHPFEINFDWIKSFGRGTRNRPLVLTNDHQGDDGVKRFQGSLCAEFAKFAPRSYSIPKFTPHVTLLYGNQELASEPIEPVHWMVKEIVLVCSEVGATKYHRLKSWALAA